MSKLFYDNLIVLEELDHHIRHAAESAEEKEELWNIVDEIIHHRVIGCVLDKLPEEDHYEFLDKFHKIPHDEELFNYINMRIDEDIEDAIKNEIADIKEELLGEIGG
jgi:hypothetical protein